MRTLPVESQGDSQETHFAADQNKQECRKGERRNVGPTDGWMLNQIENSGGESEHRTEDDQVRNELV
jgi:hypothetical protein